MWKDLFDLVRRSLRLAEDAQQTRAALKELEKVVRDLAVKSERETLQTRYQMALQNQVLQAQLDRQTDEIRRLREELQQSREREELARKLLVSEVENQLLRASRQLPSASWARTQEPSDKTEEKE
jgi:hypothetical protein